MQQSDIDIYGNNLINLLNTDVVISTPSQIQTQISTLEANRMTILSSQNTSEQNDNLINICRNEDYNKVLMYGTLSKSYFEYDNKIANETDTDLKTDLIEEKQAMKQLLCGFIGNDDYLNNLGYLIKFMQIRTC